MYDATTDIASIYSTGYESIMDHSHDFVELVYILSGTAVQHVKNEELSVAAGDILVMANDESHFIRPSTANENDFEIINVVFLPELFNVDYTKFSATTVYRVPGADEMFKKIHKEFTEKNAYYVDIIKGYVQSLLMLLMRSVNTGQNKHVRKKNMTVDVYIDKAVEFIHNNYHLYDVSVDDIVAHVGICETHLQKLFRQNRATTLYQSLLKYRIEQSCKYLLETDLSVSVICEKTGYSDIKNFYTAFKSVMGMTPNQYRNNKGKTASK